jgi:endoglucanase
MSKSLVDLDRRPSWFARCYQAPALSLALVIAFSPPVLWQGAALAGDWPAHARTVDGKLAKGVNLSHWFSQSVAGYGENRLSSFIASGDAQLIRRAGFMHVRLPVDMEWAFKSGPQGKAFLAKLIEKVSMLNNAGLAVVVALDTSEDGKKALLEPANQSEFVDGWRSLARALAQLKPDLVLLELLNEPYPLDGPQWWSLQSRTIEAIRAVAPQNTLVANPGGWSGAPDYTAEFSPVADANTIYTVHVYQPLLFTHQGATWVWPVAAQVSGVDWPLDSADVEGASHYGITDEAIRQLEYQITDGQFRVDWLRNLFDKLALWQRQHDGAPVYVGEFGVYRAVAPIPARLRWHKEVREAFEARGWGWAIWDYAGGFGIAQSDPPRKALDVSLLDALGLPRPATTGARR